MATFRKTRECLLTGYAENLIDEEEFILLYDINTSKNPDFPYWTYEKFQLDNLTDDECKAEFRFLKNDIFELAEVLHIPEEVTTYNRVKVDGLEALCIFLKRFAYPCRYSDIMPRFGRPVPQLSMISNQMINYVYDNYRHLLQDLNQPWLHPNCLQAFADAVHAKGAALDNCWGFVDGTVRPICRPNNDQRVVYNGHKRVHSIKFQSVVAPNGMIANLAGPYEGRKHDSGMLTDTGLMMQLQQYSHGTNRNSLCIYGDPAYPLRLQLQAPFRGPRLTNNQALYNKSMSKVRVAVEWVFADITNYFAFLDFKKNLKMGLSAVGKMYISCGILRNAHTCLYHSTTTDFFQINPPTIREYFQ